MKTGIFIDIDGTLTNEKKEITNFNKLVISNLIKKDDVEIYLITGKSIHNGIRYYDELNLKSKFITSAGQIITLPNEKKKIKEIFTSKEDIISIISYLQKNNLYGNILVETSDAKYLMDKVERSNLAKIISGKEKLTSLDLNSGIKNIIGSYVQLQNISEEDLAKLTKLLNKQFKNLSITYWLTEGNPHVLQIKPSEAGKASAVTFIKKEDGLDRIISFGNGNIDKNMLQISDIGVAMKNSTIEIKNSANIVSKKDNNNSGVGVELNRMFDLKLGKDL